MPVSLTPTFKITNEARERATFFNNRQYNPQFTYDVPIPPEWLERYPRVETTLWELATTIARDTTRRYPDTQALRSAEGTLLNQNQVRATVSEYFTANGISPNQVTVVFSDQAVARTSVNIVHDRCVLTIKLPITYRSLSFQSVLDHEIGTHIFRWLNEFQRPWRDSRADYNLGDHIETEEGLAALHSQLTHPVPYMWQPALYVIAVKLAEENSFSQVFEKLEPYCADPDERWRFTVRAKRGLTDTSLLGGYRKDAVYLRGATQVARWLSSHDFDPTQLYMGKVTMAESERLMPVVQRSSILVPHFVHSSQYATQLLNAARSNNLLPTL